MYSYSFLHCFIFFYLLEHARHVGDFRIGIGPNAQTLDDWEERGQHHVLSYQTTREGCFPFLYRHAHLGHEGEETCEWLPLI